MNTPSNSQNNKGGVYAIYGPNGKTYIGSSVNVEKRINQHLRALRRGDHPNSHMQASWVRHQESDFTSAILEEVVDSTLLLMVEQRWLDQLFEKAPRNLIYNLSPTAGNTLGKPCSEETRRKISEANKGRLPVPLTEETRTKLSRANKGRKHTPEARKNMGRRKGCVIPDDVRQKMSLGSTRKVSMEERERRAFTRSKGGCYTFVSPQGEYYHNIFDATNFARQHGLDPSSLLKMVKGKIRHHHGWTGYRQEVTDKAGS